MPLSKQQIQLINDNPNLSGAAIGRLVGVSRWTVNEHKESPAWTHKGVGIPFVSFNKANGQHVVRCKRREIFKGKFTKCMENLDRLIYCLENNNGKLPRTMSDAVFGGLGFIKKQGMIMKLDLVIDTKGEVSIEPLYSGRIEVKVCDVDIDDVIAAVGLGALLESMDIDEVTSELEQKGYTVSDE